MIKATEKKSDYGKTECQFNMSLGSNNAQNFQSLGSVFLVIYSENIPNKPVPVFKSENQKSVRSMFKWGRVFTNTDKLANNNDN